MQFQLTKTTWYVVGIIIAVVILFFAYSFLKKENVKNYPSSGTDIVAFGDSLIVGVGASESSSSFISLLSRRIGKPIINLGVSGNTTSDALSRIDELDKYNPKVVVVLLGGNDHLQRVPIAETFSNLTKIIKNIQDRGAIVLLLGVRGNLLGDKFKPEFEQLSDEYETAYVEDVLSGLFGNSTYMSDAVHPNDAGYQKIADRVYPILSGLLK